MQVLLKDGQLAAAEKLLREELAEQPSAIATRTNLGILLARTNRVDTALETLSKVVTQQPGYCPAELQLAAIHLQYFRIQQAEQAYLACLTQDFVHPAALLNLGILYELYLGQLDQALSFYERYQAAVSEPEVPVGRWIADLNRRLEASTINNQLAEARP
ncbi:MAG: tetratricopeptide repeat protein [Pseudomonadales bacterium]